MQFPGAHRSCAQCRRPIAFVRSEHGRAIAIDVTSREDGNVICQFLPTGGIIGRVLSSKKPRPEGVAFMPHKATCPAENRRTTSRPASPPEPPALFPTTEDPT